MTLTDFTTTLGFRNTAPTWSLHFSWSTTDPSDWVSRRKKLQPTDLLFSLSVTESHWVAMLTRHDEKFQVEWRSAGMEISSSELLYRRRTPWPTIASPLEVPGRVQKLGPLLGVQFFRCANVQGTLADEALSDSFQDHLLRQWISPAADDWRVFGRKSRVNKGGA